mgnify:CR=1
MKHNKVIYKLKNRRIRKEILNLYEKGHSLREIADIIGKSHEWVRSVIHGAVDNSDLT